MWKHTLEVCSLPTSCNQPDGKAQAGFGLVVIPLSWVKRRRLQSLLQSRNFPPFHCAHRETTLVFKNPGLSRSSVETQLLHLTRPTCMFPFNGTEMLGRIIPRLQTLPVGFPAHFSL